MQISFAPTHALIAERDVQLTVASRDIGRPTRVQVLDMNHTLHGETVLFTSGTTLSKERLKILNEVGAVPQRVAQTLETDELPVLLASEIEIELIKDVGAMRISTVKTDPEEATRLTDVFAGSLIAELTDQAEEQHRIQLETTIATLDRLQVEIRRLDGRIGSSDSLRNELLRARRDAKVREFSFAFQRREELREAGPPVAGATPDISTGGVGTVTSRLAVALFSSRSLASRSSKRRFRSRSGLPPRTPRTH